MQLKGAVRIYINNLVAYKPKVYSLSVIKEIVLSLGNPIREKETDSFSFYKLFLKDLNRA